MKNKSIYIAAAAATVLVPLALFLRTFSASPLPKPKPYVGPVPSATPPKELAVFALVTRVNHRVAAYGYRGGSLFERRDFSMVGILVKHPQGDLLIDTGFGRNIAEQFGTMSLMFRAITFYSLWQPAVDQLRAAGYDQKSHIRASNLPPSLGTWLLRTEGFTYKLACCTLAGPSQ